MKNYISPSYTFTPGGTGVGTVKTGIRNFNIKFLIVILNVTREEIIYAPGLSGRGYTSISSDTITLEYSTSGHSSTDILQFLYESTNDYPSVVDSSRNNDLLAQMQRLTKIAESLQVVDSAQRQRITIDSIAASLTLGTVTTVGSVTSLGTLTTVSTVTSVTNIASNAGMDREQYINIAKQTYANSIRSRLTIQ
jgi:hypothetical protein